MKFSLNKYLALSQFSSDVIITFTLIFPQELLTKRRIQRVCQHLHVNLAVKDLACAFRGMFECHRIDAHF